MKASFLVLLSAAMGLAFALPVAAQQLPGAASIDVDRMRAEYTSNVLRDYNSFMNQWRSSLDDAEAGTAAGLYTNEATLLVSGTDAALGRDAIEGLLGRIMPQLMDIRTGLTDFVASDNIAVATGPIIMSYRQRGSAVTHTVTGNHITVLIRDHRRWRIRSQVLQYDAKVPLGG